MAYVEGRTDGCRSGSAGTAADGVALSSLALVRAGACLTAGGQATIERSQIAACEHNKKSSSVECHIFATTSFWRLPDIQRFPMRTILN